MFETIDECIHFRASTSFDSNITFLDCGASRVLIDTGTGLFHDRLEQDLAKIGRKPSEITDIVLTHSHIDHIGGVANFLDNEDLTVHLHRIEAERINKGDLELTLVDTFGGELPAFRVGHLLEEGNTLEFGDLSLRVLHTPGHSAGSICLHEERLGIIITGDTLFPGGSFGRVDLPTGNYQDLLASLKRLSEIDFEIALPGHMNPIRRDAKRAAYLSYEVARGMFSSW